MKKAKIDNKMVEIVDKEMLATDVNMPYGYTAVQIDDTVYPLRGKNDTRAGIYPINKYMSKIVRPDKDEKENYSASRIIDFSSAKTVKELIDKQNRVKEEERSILTNIDNIFCPQIDENDAPEMRALKQAVGAKGIDIEKYESRFGDNYNNDIRLFNKNSITLSKLKSICSNLDIRLSLTLRDMNDDVPNPMKTEIKVDLSNGVD